MSLMQYSKETKDQQTKQQKIAIDLRSLNYPILTGVNTYCLHFLAELAKLKQKNPKLRITGIGLIPTRRDLLIKQFPVLTDLFERYLSLEEYTKLKLPGNRLKNMFMTTTGKHFGWYESPRITVFDYIFLIQPKPLWKNPKTKQICIFHDIYSVLEPQSTNLTNRPTTNQNLYKLIAKYSHKIWAVSFSTSWDLKSLLGIPEEKIKTVYPAKPNLLGFDNPQPENKLTNLPRKYILAISGIEKRKNWHNLLLAYHHLQKQNFACPKLVLAGRIVDRSYFSELQKMITRLEIVDICWVLNPSEQEKTKLIQEAFFMVYPSFYEGFGFPLLEAFAAGKCMLTSKLSSMPEIGQDAALYINPLNFLDISRGLKILLTNPDLRLRLEKNTTKVAAKYNWLETQEAIANILYH